MLDPVSTVDKIKYEEIGNQAQAFINRKLKSRFPVPFINYSAFITGDNSLFTGIAGDTINITIDGNTYEDIDISTALSVSDIITAINTAVGSTVATLSTLGYLVITSPIIGSSSITTITDGTNTLNPCVNRIFTITSKTKKEVNNIPPEVTRLTLDYAVGILWCRGYGQGEGLLERGENKKLSVERQLDSMALNNESLYLEDDTELSGSSIISGYPDASVEDPFVFKKNKEYNAGTSNEF